ncbi:MAG: bifunctional homocysteine S-methyltransferase/methylenetetrahydrofolate reductase [Anaerolineales bacterium]|nr:bifunctional homocysteine S-methyltransferase/methylenetetrahydrofolate reductase [Anaerolineales bacterium]MCW5855325.1 bifunctional homocysteine S-methyltransferase/methylenetetrahydrofolate reductase [Anaerolineales bacterium]
MTNLLDTLNESTLLADGAMGTVLHEQGVDFTRCFDELNLSQPELVQQIHATYLAAGAQIIMSNTFGSNRFRLAEHGLQDKAAEISRAGVQLARQAVAAYGKDALVAADVGPLGVRLAPFGRVDPDEARAAFEEQLGGLLAGKPDLVIIETMTDLHEAREALKAAKALSELPVVVSMTFTRDDRTLLGDTPAKVARKLHEAGADVIGINCSGGPAQLLRILKQMRAAVPDAQFSVMPNAGWPEQAGGRIRYPAGPEYFGQYAVAFRQAGAALIGGCCGTTPEHIQAMRHALDNPGAISALANGQISVVEQREPLAGPDKGSQLAEKIAAGKFVSAVEMDPPRGLSTYKLQAGADLLAESGVDVINVADSPMARMRMSPWAVCDLIQRHVGVETTLHFPTRGRNLLRVQGDLLAAHALGVRNVFVVMGDPTSIGDYPDAMDNYDLAPTGLIKLIKQQFNTGRDHAGAEIGQPTAFHVGAALNLAPPDAEREAKLLARKLRNGADFFLTQPVYDPAQARQFLEQHAESLEKPLLVGILPLFGVRHANFLHNEVPGIIIPAEIRRRMEAAGSQGPQEGVRIAIELIEQIRAWGAGVYLMPAFNRFDLAAQILESIS